MVMMMGAYAGIIYKKFKQNILQSSLSLALSITNTITFNIILIIYLGFKPHDRPATYEEKMERNNKLEAKQDS